VRITRKKCPTVFGPYRLWSQTVDGSVGHYQIHPTDTLAIWLIDNTIPESAGFWAMVCLEEDGWQSMNVEPLPSFEFARSVIQGYCQLHNFQEGT
jgi:hypothetical protein